MRLEPDGALALARRAVVETRPQHQRPGERPEPRRDVHGARAREIVGPEFV